MFNHTFLKWQEPGLQKKYLQSKYPVSIGKRIRGIVFGILSWIGFLFLGLLLEGGWPDSPRQWQGLIFLSVGFGLAIVLILTPIYAYAKRKPIQIRIHKKQIERRSWTATHKFLYKNFASFSFSILSIGDEQTDVLVLLNQTQNVILFEMSSDVTQGQVISVLEKFLVYEPDCPIGSFIAFDQINIETEGL